MSLPRGPRFPTFAGVRRPPTGKDRPILGVGWRVLVTAGGGSSKRVTLTDETGTSALGTVADGVEVEILAWRPRPGGDTRYRVFLRSGGLEGWLGAGSLRPRVTPAPAKPAAPPPAPAALPLPARVRTAAAAPPPPRRTPVAAKSRVPVKATARSTR